MEPLSILMFIFGGALLAYAGIIALCGYEAIPRNYATKVKDEKRYAKKFAMLLAMIALTIILAGAAALWRLWAGGVVLLTGIITIIMNGHKLTGITDELDSTGSEKQDEDEIL